MNLASLVVLAALAPTLIACADEGDFSTEAARIEGIYQVDRTSLTTGGCVQPERPEREDQFAFAVRGSLFGQDYLGFYSCSSPADCRAKAAQQPFVGTTDFDFVVTAAAGEMLVGEGVSTGFAQGSRCTQPEAWDTSLELIGTSLRIERSTRIGSDYAANSDGFCTTEAALQATETATCSALETLLATKIEQL